MVLILKYLKKFLYKLFFFVIILLWLGIIGLINSKLTGASLESGGVWLLPIAITILTLVFWLIWQKEIKENENTKSRFLTIASHQFRTPLTRMQWTLASLSSELNTDKQKELLLNIKSMVSDLVKGSNYLLDATEANKKKSLYYDYIFEKGNLSASLSFVLGIYAPGLQNKNIAITTDMRQGLPLVFFDRERINQAMSVFLENAIIYTPSGGSIHIKLYLEKENIVFSVRDSGIGIQKNMLTHIFTKFFRTKRAISMDANRTGLGLSVAKDIIKNHKGSVFVKSEGQDKGSVFGFKIPIIK